MQHIVKKQSGDRNPLEMSGLSDNSSGFCFCASKTIALSNVGLSKCAVEG